MVRIRGVKAAVMTAASHARRLKNSNTEVWARVCEPAQVKTEEKPGLLRYLGWREGCLLLQGAGVTLSTLDST